MAGNSANSSFQARPSGWNYFEIDDILACQEKIPCTFQTQVKDLGFLDHSSDTERIEKGTKLELPFWLAKELNLRQRKVVSVELPKPYREAYRQIFEADAMVVDLHKLGPYFYSVGCKVLEFGNQENPRIAETMMMAYMKRLTRLMDVCLNNLDGSVEVQAILSRLDHEESNIFSISRDALREFEQWKVGLISKITTSKTVINERKRKRTEDD